MAGGSGLSALRSCRVRDEVTGSAGRQGTQARRRIPVQRLPEAIYGHRGYDLRGQPCAAASVAAAGDGNTQGSAGQTSLNQFHKDVAVTYKTAWSMAQRLRYGMTAAHLRKGHRLSFRPSHRGNAEGYATTAEAWQNQPQGRWSGRSGQADAAAPIAIRQGPVRRSWGETFLLTVPDSALCCFWERRRNGVCERAQREYIAARAAQIAPTKDRQHPLEFVREL